MFTFGLKGEFTQKLTPTSLNIGVECQRRDSGQTETADEREETGTCVFKQIKWMWLSSGNSKRV